MSLFNIKLIQIDYGTVARGGRQLTYLLIYIHPPWHLRLQWQAYLSPYVIHQPWDHRLCCPKPNAFGVAEYSKIIFKVSYKLLL